MLDQWKPFEHPFADAGLGAQIQAQWSIAPFEQLLLAFPFVLGELDAGPQRFLQLGIAFQDGAHGLLRDHQQHRVAGGPHGHRLRHVQQAGVLAEHLPMAQNSQGQLDAALHPNAAHRAPAHHVEPAVLKAILLQDGIPGRHLFDADAVDQLDEFVLIDLAAQLEQLTDETTGGIDAGLTGQQTADHRMTGQYRGDDIAGNEHQLGLAGSARGEFEAVVAQRGGFGQQLAGTTDPDTDVLAAFRGQQAHHAGFDDIQTQSRFPGRENRIAEVVGLDFSPRGQVFQVAAADGSQQFDAGQGFEQNFGTHRTISMAARMDD